jgi:UDP-glucuronate 4-epimerase
VKVLVTGAAGFIGFHVASRLLARGDDVVGFDNVNSYYDPALKEARLAELEKAAGESSGSYAFIRADLADRDAVEAVFAAHRLDRVIHLAAQAGVRYSLSDPHSYIQSNVVGFLHVLEGCRHHGVAHLTYASTSSVYGANTTLPYSEHHGANHPLQLYAATKRANELMAHSYSHLYRLPTTGLRFFTVYGPWGRPDMAPFIFARNILEGREIEVFNEGRHSRDFTYVDDIAEGVILVSDDIAEPNAAWQAEAPDPASSSAPYRIFNIGNESPVVLAEFIEAVEAATGRKANRVLKPMQPGDVPDTHADISELKARLGFRPKVSVREGVGHFVDWYRRFYAV